MLRGDNGILNRGAEAKFANGIAQFEEQTKLAAMSVKTSIEANKVSTPGYIATYNGTGTDDKNYFIGLANEVAKELGVTALLISSSQNEKIKTEGYTVGYYLETEGNVTTNGDGYIIIWYTDNGLRSSIDREKAKTIYGLKDIATEKSVNQATLVRVIHIENYKSELSDIGLTSTTDGDLDLKRTTGNVIETLDGTSGTNTMVSDYSNDVKTKLALNLNASTDEAKSPWVKYGGDRYKVLYNDANGIEIIKMENFYSIDEHFFCYDDREMPENAPTGYDFDNTDADISQFEKARWSYNNYIENINKKTEKLYPSNDIIDSARCVGSKTGKTNKNFKNSTIISRNSYMSEKELEQGEELYEYDASYNETIVVSQPNYTSDFQRMTELGILLDDCSYLLASRGLMQHPDYLELDIFYMNSGNLMHNFFLNVSSNGYTINYDMGYPIRPVLLLKHDVIIGSGNGTYETPYILHTSEIEAELEKYLSTKNCYDENTDSFQNVPGINIDSSQLEYISEYSEGDNYFDMYKYIDKYYKVYFIDEPSFQAMVIAQ